VRHAESPARRKLYAADVFCGTNTDGAAATIAEAPGWLAREHVPVVNVSLVGPPNQLLERVIAGLVARGHLVVAAVGNDGPTAKPLPGRVPGRRRRDRRRAHRRVLIKTARTAGRLRNARRGPARGGVRARRLRGTSPRRSLRIFGECGARTGSAIARKQRRLRPVQSISARQGRTLRMARDSSAPILSTRPSRRLTRTRCHAQSSAACRSRIKSHAAVPRPRSAAAAAEENARVDRNDH
jgi:hypothetical protein